MNGAVEFRGVERLCFAEVTEDNNESAGGYITGPVTQLAPVAEISKEIAQSSKTSHYDNKAMIIINAQGEDTVTFAVPVLPLDVLATLTGQYYDATTGALSEGTVGPVKYFAVGYVLNLTDESKRYIWRYKGRFAPPKDASKTQDGGTDSQGQSMVYTGVKTIHRFAKNNKSASALVVDERDELADLSTFFDTVTTIDTIQSI